MKEIQDTSFAYLKECTIERLRVRRVTMNHVGVGAISKQAFKVVEKGKAGVGFW